MDFLSALSVPTCEIRLAGSPVTVKQRPLLGHYRLRTIARQLVDDLSPVERLALTFEYLSVATGIEDLSGVGPLELAPALDRLRQLNEQVEALPWQTVYNIKAQAKSTSADYDNRVLAVIVSTLAAAFGWSHEAILALPPEAAYCYVQEVLLDDWERRQFEFRLSRVAYDEHGKPVPFPKPDWYHVTVGPTVEEAKAKVPKRFVPAGVVIDPSQPKEGTS